MYDNLIAVSQQHSYQYTHNLTLYMYIQFTISLRDLTV